MAVDLYKLLFYRRRLRDPLLIVLILVLALAGLVKLPMLDEPVSGQVQVIDGDSLQIGEQRFRLFGIDAPEGRQSCKRDGQKYRCGEEATTALRGLIGANPVTCLKQDTDSYGRIVAICSVGGVEVNRWMVAHGHALAYRNYSQRYVPDEEQAKAAKLGLWAGTFQKPWDYRHASQ